MLTDLSAEEVRNLFAYDPDEGLLRWRNAAGRYGRIPAGTVAGRIHEEGYRYVTIYGRHYRASRIIWLWMTEKWPEHQVDHEDRNPGNDKWDNLRRATGSQNKANCRKYRNKSCDLKGVQAVQKRRSIRYRAIATKNGQRVHLGYFDTPELAHAAYLSAAEMMHGEFASDGKERAGNG